MATAARSRPTGPPGYSKTLPRAEETVQTARSLARAAVATWGMDHLATAAELVMSELVTNAVLHAWGPSLRVFVERPADDRVCLTVVDRAPQRTPKLRTPGPDDATGRGLLLVDDAADRWGYDMLGPRLRPWGKRVWAELEAAP
ncbi:ATP-binding protein [Streptomyces shenzhenensis]|uniref:ATP-binding protein n=1 Tax=Streptomyces shenzhenensis TaxID=943815 RepID=UPI003D8D44F3